VVDPQGNEQEDEEAMWDWDSDPEFLAAIEREAQERDTESLKALEGLFGREGAEQFIKSVLSRPKDEKLWPETPESRAGTALGQITLSSSLRKKLRYRGGDGTIRPLE